MNNKRRKDLKDIRDQLSDLKDRVELLQGEEMDAFDNIPENLQGSQSYNQSENAISNLEEAVSNLDTAIDCIEAAAE